LRGSRSGTQLADVVALAVGDSTRGLRGWERIWGRKRDETWGDMSLLNRSHLSYKNRLTNRCSYWSWVQIKPQISWESPIQQERVLLLELL
jgi:hypothetical protein